MFFHQEPYGRLVECCIVSQSEVCLQVAESARKFIITQFGLSCFIWNGNNLQAHTYNFYIVPREVPGFNKRFLVDVRFAEPSMTPGFCPFCSMSPGPVIACYSMQVLACTLHIKLQMMQSGLTSGSSASSLKLIPCCSLRCPTRLSSLGEMFYLSSCQGPC